MKAMAVVLLVCSVVMQAAAVSAQVRDAEGHARAGVVYYGPKQSMTFKEFAAYLAPVIWFSPDEPLLDIQKDGYFQLPLPLPFETPTDSAVVYYRISRIIGREDAEIDSFWTMAPEKNDSVLHLEQISQITLHFFFYYDRESGVGAHPHDYETTEFSIDILHEGDNYGLEVTEVIAHAHGVPWYFNVLRLDEAPDARFPLTILVEEGKHGNCTDRNGDGFYSPGYDVNRRVNDAWGVRDIMSVGVVITPNYQTWMTKVRWMHARIAPPLPEDSPWYEEFTTHYALAEHNKRQYQLRPVPDIRNVDFSTVDNGNMLKHWMEDKGYPDWPEGEERTLLTDMSNDLFDESFLGSWGYGFRYDGDPALTITFPLLFVRNFEVPMIGGWLVQRVYFNFGLISGDFKVWGHQFTYTPSASRWIDWYVGGGYQVRDIGGDVNKTRFTYEAGNKFRVNVSHSPFKFLRYLGSDFWGLRVGVQALGWPEIEALGFIIEVGAGVW